LFADIDDDAAATAATADINPAVATDAADTMLLGVMLISMLLMVLVLVLLLLHTRELYNN
jgi:hypothetical protein